MASVQFTDVQARPSEFLDLTSVTLDEFQQLIPPFEAAFHAHMAAWRLDGKPRTARQFAVYQNCPLPTPEDRHLRKRAGQEAQLLHQSTASRERGGRGLRNAQIMGTAAVGVAQKEDDEQGIDQQDIFDGVVLFLPTITLRLFSRVLGADNAPFGPVMGKRGASGATTGTGASSREPTTEAASASETPSRWARAVRERAGASPRARSAASNAGNRTWIH